LHSATQIAGYALADVSATHDEQALAAKAGRQRAGRAID